MVRAEPEQLLGRPPWWAMLMRTARGFTVIELMVVIAMIGLMLVIGMPGFSAWLQSTQIRTSAEAIQNGLSLARAEAIQRNSQVLFQLTTTLDNTCATSTTGINWVISMDPAAGKCASAPSADAAVPVTPRIVQVRAGIEGSRNAAVTAGQAVVAFNGMGRVSPLPAGTINIDVTNPVGGSCVPSGQMRCMRVQVSPVGQVRLCDPQLASTDPRGCLP